MGSGHYLIVGLGNPGKQYEATRHNVGFWAVEAFAKARLTKSHWDSVGNALVCSQSKGPRVITLMKPETFMNLSGEAVLPFIKQNNIPLENILIIYDDIDLEVGKVRFRPSGSAGTHNGLASIVESLQSEKIPRLRLGVGPYDGQQDLKDFVLDPFNAEQLPLMEAVAKVHSIKMISDWMMQGMTKVQNQYNGLRFAEASEEKTPQKQAQNPPPQVKV